MDEETKSLLLKLIDIQERMERRLALLEQPSLTPDAGERRLCMIPSETAEAENK